MKDSTKKRLAFYALLFLIVISIFVFQKTRETTKSVTYTKYLDTVCDITITSKTDKPFKICEEYLNFAQKEFSAEDKSSTLYNYNHYQKMKYSDDLLKLISIGEEYSKKYPEYFSIHLDELINLWNITGSPTKVPSSEEIEKSLKNKSVNLGGIAKGYITDKLVNKLKDSDVDSALINLGGNIYALGKKQNGTNWKIGIQNPKDESKIIGAITAENLAIVTSGDYQRYVEIDGKKYHHIFNPKTGFPVDNGIRSVTVICEDATTADALSTIAFVAGIEEGNKILKEHNAMGIFITDDKIYFSKSLENIFRQDDLSYKYEFLY